MKCVVRVRAHLRKGRPVRAHFARKDFKLGFGHGMQSLMHEESPIIYDARFEKEEKNLSKRIRKAVREKKGSAYRDYMRGYRVGSGEEDD